jgi:hypothetical protein
MGAFSTQFGLGWVETPRGKPARVDGLLVKNGELNGVGEVKCRYNLTLPKFKRLFDMEWLVTASKIEKCKELASGLQVPFIGFMFLVDEGVSGLLLWKRLDQLTLRSERTETQATINGGTTHRLNAFIPMKHCKGLRL